MGVYFIVWYGSGKELEFIGVFLFVGDGVSL